jgi:hypothetical protein
VAKKADPVLATLKDKQAKAGAEFDRWYARLGRALTAANKARARLRRVDKQIRKHLAEKEGKAAPAAP